MAKRKKKAGTALTQIVAEAKRIRKRSPHKYDRKANSWRDGYMAEASAIHRKKKRGTGGTKKRKKTAKKRKRVGSITLKETHEARISRTPKRRAKKHTAKRKHTARKRSVGTVRRAGSVAPRRRSVGKTGISTGLLVGLGALGIGAYLLLHKPANTTPTLSTLPPLAATANQVRYQQSQDIVNYAIAAGLAYDTISKLIDRLNNSNDTSVQAIYDHVDSTGDLSAWV